MNKFLPLIIISISFNACSYFTFNAAMCEQIAADPNAVITEECRNYLEEEAQKAFFKNKTEVEIDKKDVEFNKEKKEEK